MPTDMHRQARKRVDEKRKFYRHLSTYLVMSVFFFVINVITSPSHWWFIYPMLGWGMGVAAQYFQVFGFPGVGPTNEDWEARELEDEIRRLESGASYSDKEDALDLPEMERPARKPWDEDELV